MQSEHTPKEFSILSYIEQNSDATQRQLSEHVGVSLGGMINILLKRLVKKGLVKIERLQPNSVKYFLTPPQGIASKLERTYGYIVRTYRELVSFQQQLYREIEKNMKLYKQKNFCYMVQMMRCILLLQGYKKAISSQKLCNIFLHPPSSYSSLELKKT